jgi:hypothetical protein
MQLDNTDNLLRPGAYADVLFEVGLDRRLAVPDSALLLGADGRWYGQHHCHDPDCGTRDLFDLGGTPVT